MYLPQLPNIGTGKTLKFGSMNVSGLQSNSAKRIDIFNWVKQKHIDIMVLQETHSGLQDEKKWISEWDYKGFFTNYGTNSRGVGILFNNTFEFELHKVVKDAEGRYVILDITTSNTKITIAGIYGPNSDSPNFFVDLQNQIEMIGNTSVLVVGDWNVVLDYDLDTKGLKQNNNPRAQSQIQQMCLDLRPF